MIQHLHVKILTIMFLSSSSFWAMSQDEVEYVVQDSMSEITAFPETTDVLPEEKKSADINYVIFSHIADGHDWHLLDYTDAEGIEHPVSIPLPVILINTNPFSITTFWSSKFHHGLDPVTKGDYTYVWYKNKIYYADDCKGTLRIDASGKVLNNKPIDISITKNVVSLLVVALLMIWMFIACAKAYTKRVGKAPIGMQAFMEPIILFVRNEIAIPNIGHKKHEKFLPYLLTVFFFIWFLNLLGLVPVFPGGANATGNIAVTMTLALFTLFITNIYANKNYWKHIFAMPGIPFWLLPIMIVVELIGIFTKPFALTIRLFANITAGHIIVLSLVGLIFIFESVYIAPASILFVIFMLVVKIFVALLQAFIFTMLSALFIGMAQEEAHH